MPFLSHPLTERSEDGGREERDEQRIGEAKRRRDEVRHGPTAVFHLLRLVQGKLYRYTPRLIENLPKAGINLGFSFFICRTFIIGGFY